MVPEAMRMECNLLAPYGDTLTGLAAIESLQLSNVVTPPYSIAVRQAAGA